MSEISLAGVLVTFQVTFTELFIASTVISSVAYKHGWQSAALGSLGGALAVAVVSFGLAQLGLLLPMTALDWISALLLLGFGVFLLYEFWAAHQVAEEAVETLEVYEDPSSRRAANALSAGNPLIWSGIIVAFWGMFAEGLEIMVVWLGIALKQGMATATAGVLIGLAVIGVTALLLGKAGVFRRLPAKYLDLIAGVMVSLYGVHFITEASGA
ncbi:hypothetical protein [Methylococcus capsulatus]|jgi:uncharacterized membrane protein|uniref:hypothetical protein n=1 Tax=Methylococcus capsulatus TaxID=414 RepID=UPI0002D3A1A6|nr:hypothetical protein [Methylococcus capsulatus]